MMLYCKKLPDAVGLKMNTQVAVLPLAGRVNTSPEPRVESNNKASVPVRLYTLLPTPLSEGLTGVLVALFGPC